MSFGFCFLFNLNLREYSKKSQHILMRHYWLDHNSVGKNILFYLFACAENK